MSFSSISSVSAASSDALLVRDVDGQHRPALAEEVRRVLANRVRRGATMSSPQAVKDHLRLEIGMLEHEVFYMPSSEVPWRDLRYSHLA